MHFIILYQILKHNVKRITKILSVLGLCTKNVIKLLHLIKIMQVCTVLTFLSYLLCYKITLNCIRFNFKSRKKNNIMQASVIQQYEYIWYH